MEPSAYMEAGLPAHAVPRRQDSYPLEAVQELLDLLRANLLAIKDFQLNTPVSGRITLASAEQGALPITVHFGHQGGSWMLRVSGARGCASSDTGGLLEALRALCGMYDGCRL